VGPNDRIAEFFAELDRRGHDPLLDRVNCTGRVEITDDGRLDQWLVSIKGGYISVAHGGGDSDWVMRAERDAFVRVIHGDAGSLAAIVRGTLELTMLDDSQRFGLLTRIFAGHPETRQRTPDPLEQR
jgi:hypothetical protein